LIYRRQRKQFIFAILLIVIAVLNGLFYLILNRPARNEYAELQKSIGQLQLEIEKSEEARKALEDYTRKIKDFDKDKNNLLMTHLIQRGTGYSQILSKIDGVAQKAGVKKTHVSYTLNQTPIDGLSQLAIVIPLEGPYSNIVNFIRELESSDTFFVIDAITLEATSGQAVVPAQTASAPFGAPRPVVAPTPPTNSGGAVSLALAVETYLYQ